METSAKNLGLETFMQVVRNAPLISIDLLVYNQDNEILLGWRKNEPARDCWFVPGGRILKDETIRSAFTRIVLAETGLHLTTEQADFHGLYEHFYPDANFAGEPGFGTHYVVLAFEIKLSSHEPTLPREQHVRYCWMHIDTLLDDPQVNQFVKNYFNGTETW